MKLHVFSYRFAEEIIQHSNHSQAWNEIKEVLRQAPLFIYPHKSKKNKNLDVVQQLMNLYFDKVLSEKDWDYHPLATKIKGSQLKADFRKSFNGLNIQAEIQFGNMSRWYTDIFKFQAAYSQSLTDIALSVIPMASLAKRIDSNVVQFERAKRELPSAQLSITLPVLMIGLEPDRQTKVLNVSKCKFRTLKNITGRKRRENMWRIVNGFFEGRRMEEIGPKSRTGRMLESEEDEE